MKWIRLAPGLLLVLPLIGFSATLPHLQEGQSFTQARARLIKAKWKPVPMHVDDHYGYEGVEKQLVKRRFKEVDSCSVDSSRCILYYKKGGQCLRLDTMGEQVKFMKVVRWSEECPGAPLQKAD